MSCDEQLPNSDDVTVALRQFIYRFKGKVKLLKCRVLTDEDVNLSKTAAHMHAAIAKVYDNDKIENINGNYFNLFHYGDVMVAAIVGDVKSATSRIAKLLKSFTVSLDAQKAVDVTMFCGLTFTGNEADPPFDDDGELAFEDGAAGDDAFLFGKRWEGIEKFFN